METVAERLKELRRLAGSPTQKVVAKAIGCAYRSYQNWEQGASSNGRIVVPSYRNALALARYFDTTPEYILYGIDEDAPTRVELEALDQKLNRVLMILSNLFEDQIKLDQDQLFPIPDTAKSAPGRRRKAAQAGAGRSRARREAAS
jgi:transcriptional regulator with XRE-family HTH domain